MALTRTEVSHFLLVSLLENSRLLVCVVRHILVSSSNILPNVWSLLNDADKCKNEGVACEFSNKR